MNTIYKYASQFLGVAVLALVTATVTTGATFTVTKVADTSDGVCDADCSLKEAVGAANAVSSNDVIAFDPSVFNVPRTISLGTTSLSIANNGSLTINGPGTDLLTIDCNINTAIATNSNAVTALANFTVTGSLSGTSGRIFNGLNANMSIGNMVILNSGQALPGVWNTGQITVDNCTFMNNKGNGLYNDRGTMTVTNSSLTNNWGGISNDRGTLNVMMTTISGNSGAGIFNTSGPVTLDHVTISGNIRAAGFGNDGGGISTYSDLFPGPLFTITNCIIRGNRVSGENSDGGGISNVGSTVMNISNSEISGNVSLNANGGGIHAAGAVSIINSTIYGNTAGLDGGGIFANSTSSLTNTTISRNSAGSRGGGVFGTPSLRASIIGDNLAPTGPDASGTLASLGFNLIENVNGAAISGTLTGNILGKDPQLVTLANNGGDTLTVALQPTSPAIDSGDPSNTPATDQRNVSRPQDGDLNGISTPDIGSYERTVFVRIVTKTADTNDGVCDLDCSLREAISAANVTMAPDNAIVFDPAVFSSAQIITLSGGELVVSTPRTVVILGPGANLLTISGNGASRVLTVAQGANAAISNIKIAGGNGVGTAFPDWGGGILIREAVLGIANSLVSGNTTSSVAGNGGGIYNFRGTLNVMNSRVANNSGWNGGGIYNSNFGGLLNMSDSIVQTNSAGMGAGILNQGTATIDNSDILNNTSSGGCGGINGGETLTLSGSRIRFNSGGSGSGGGICGPSVGTITNSTVDGNTATSGGGIAGGTELVITSTSVQNNVASARGGGIETGLGTISLVRSMVSGNRASYGGGINVAGPLTIINSTISRNSAAGSFGGGGIFSEINVPGSLVISNATVAFNSALIGGGIRNNSGPVSLRNTIVSDNFASQASPDFDGALTSQGYNLIENITGTVISGTTTGNILGQDPSLDPVARMNGGPTRTHALRATSAAVDRGSATVPVTTTDQRGFTRPYDVPTRANAPGGNASDIGAYERQQNERAVPTWLDFDGDGKTDIGIFRPAGAASEWWINRSSTGQTFALQFGASTDKIAPADYTGDGKSDIAFFRPASGEWYVLRSEDFSFFALPFGANGDVPVPADYDADGNADFAVFRPSSSTWFISQSSGAPTRIEQFGVSGDVPVVADYDGDGKSDIGIFRQNGGVAEWWINRSTAGSLALQFGASTDKAVQGDYTGDGKADIAVWRPSTGEWFIVRSEDSSFYGFPFGSTGDVPASGDYDGDGKFDATVFRPSSATWFISRTSGGTQIVQFGAAGDLPIPNAFVP